MANFEDMLRMFCSDTGRHDLVEDFAGGDYTDNGAGDFINAGQEFLDRRHFKYLGGDTTYVATLAAGEYELEVPKVRHINSVWVRVTSADDSEKVKLIRKTKDELRSLYLIDFAEVEQGEPSYYARSEGLVSAEDSDAWYLRVDNTGYVEGGTADWAMLIAFTFFDSFDVNNNGIVTYAETGSNAVLYAALGLDSSVDLTRAMLVSMVKAAGRWTIRTGKEISYTDEKLIILPISDVEREVEVVGAFYAVSFSSPTDETVWSIRFPHLLNLAAQFKHEVALRNKAGANEVLQRINEELVSLNMEEIDEEDVDAEFIQIEG